MLCDGCMNEIREPGVVARCSCRGCSNIATYLIRYKVQCSFGKSKQQQARRITRCGRHFRKWLFMYDPRRFPEKWAQVPDWIARDN